MHRGEIIGQMSSCSFEPRSGEDWRTERFHHTRQGKIHKPLTSNNYRGTCKGSTLQFSSSVLHRARMTWKKRLQQRQITIIAEPALHNSCSFHMTPTQHISIGYLCRPNTAALLQHARTHTHTHQVHQSCRWMKMCWTRKRMRTVKHVCAYMRGKHSVFHLKPATTATLFLAQFLPSYSLAAIHLRLSGGSH